jgi:hypothetical protein
MSFFSVTPTAAWWRPECLIERGVASDWRSACPQYRSDIGRGILLGLELLVGAELSRRLPLR